MPTWKHRLDLASLWAQYHDAKVLGTEIARLIKSQPWYEDYYELEQIVMEFEDVEDVEDFDIAMEELYDWGDFDKTCWIATL